MISIFLVQWTVKKAAIKTDMFPLLKYYLPFLLPEASLANLSSLEPKMISS